MRNRASPHTRGWTLHADRGDVRGCGFPAHAGMEQVTLIGQASADHDGVARRKSLISRGLRNRFDLADPPYRDHMWDQEWDHDSGSYGPLDVT